VTLDALNRQYERAEVDVQRSSDGKTYQVASTNVSRLVLRETIHARAITIDETATTGEIGTETTLEKNSLWVACGTQWKAIRTA